MGHGPTQKMTSWSHFNRSSSGQEGSGGGVGLACLGEMGALKERWLWERGACRKGNFLTVLLILSGLTCMSDCGNSSTGAESIFLVFFWLHHLI